MPTATKTKAAAKKKAVAMEDDVDGVVETEVKAPKVAKPKAPRKSRAKVVEPPRAKLYWGVFNQNLKRVAVFDYEKKKDAEKHVKELSKPGSEHFLQRIKEAIEA
jgi:hypothetical protein